MQHAGLYYPDTHNGLAHLMQMFLEVGVVEGAQAACVENGLCLMLCMEGNYIFSVRSMYRMSREAQSLPYIALYPTPGGTKTAWNERADKVMKQNPRSTCEFRACPFCACMQNSDAVRYMHGLDPWIFGPEFAWFW